MKLILTGATGLIGSRFEELLYEKHEIIPLSASKGVDITNPESVSNFFNNKLYDAVIHLAGKADVDACEEDKPEDLESLRAYGENVLGINMNSLDIMPWIGKSSAIAVNAVGTKILYDEVKKSNSKFIYISSDFVFSGNEDSYSENSNPNPVNWYGMSKYLGEQTVDRNSDLIVRIAFPYGHSSPVKKDFVWKLHDLMQGREEVSLISDQVITPTFIDDIVMGLDFLLSSNSSGIVNLVGSTSLSPKDIGVKLKKKFNLHTQIKESSLSFVYEGKARRPLRSVMKNDKLKNMGFIPKSFDEGLALVVS